MHSKALPLLPSQSSPSRHSKAGFYTDSMPDAEHCQLDRGTQGQAVARHSLTRLLPGPLHSAGGRDDSHQASMTHLDGGRVGVLPGALLGGAASRKGTQDLLLQAACRKPHKHHPGSEGRQSDRQARPETSVLWVTLSTCGSLTDLCKPGQVCKEAPSCWFGRFGLLPALHSSTLHAT